MEVLFKLDVPKQRATRKFYLVLIDQKPIYDNGASKYCVAIVFEDNLHDRGSGFYTDSIAAAFERFKSEADRILEDYPIRSYEFSEDITND